jgi:glycosyltransferase involved in cell wall biosynthesis
MEKILNQQTKTPAHKKIYFITRLKIPKNTAYSNNILKVIEAFHVIGRSPTLVARGRNIFSQKNSLDVSSIKQETGAECVLTSNSNILFYISVFVYALTLKKKDHAIYTRDPELAFLFQLVGFECACHIHGVFSPGFLTLLKWLALRFGTFDLHFVSNGLAQNFKENINLKNHEIFISRNGVINKKYSADLNPQPPELIKEGAGPVCTFAGSLYRGRGSDLLISLAQHNPSVQFHVLGTYENVDKKNILEKLPNLHLHGYRSATDVRCWLVHSDILLMPYENIVYTSGGQGHSSAIIGPIKMFEYLAANQVIISSDLPGLREVLNEKNAVLVKSFNVEEWSKALVLALSSESAIKSLRNEAKKTSLLYDLPLILSSICEKLD